jgi:MarR family transcriptional regulator, organic hydroperoxide resistance regulator
MSILVPCVVDKIACELYFYMPRKSADCGHRPEVSDSLPLELPRFLCFTVYSASHAFTRVYQPLLKPLRLTYPQFIAMILLWEEDGQTVNELGRKLFLKSNTLTPMLKRLEALSYIKRTQDGTDARQVRIHLTEAGRKLHLKASEIVRAVRKTTGLPERQFTELRAEVETLRDALESHDLSKRRV